MNKFLAHIDNYIENTKIRWANSRKVVGEIKRGEWECERVIDGIVYKIQRKSDGLILWVANGPFFLAKDHGFAKRNNIFGYIFRHYVWWAAARKLKKNKEFFKGEKVDKI